MDSVIIEFSHKMALDFYEIWAGVSSFLLNFILFWRKNILHGKGDAI